MRYNSKEYVDAYLEHGAFPAIHDDIFEAAKLIPNAGTLAALDLGACTGLLTIRMRQVFSGVKGIEASPENVSRAAREAEVKLMKITPATLKDFQGELAGIGVIIARRVFPELYDSNVAFELPELFFRNGIEYVLLEGRMPVRNPSNALWNADIEANIFAPLYGVVERHKNVRLLKRGERPSQ
jgi:hypothetical protein